jgi:hypothetical protein
MPGSLHLKRRTSGRIGECKEMRRELKEMG